MQKGNGEGQERRESDPRGMYQKGKKEIGNDKEDVG
jgi:hypothetical protein